MDTMIETNMIFPVTTDVTVLIQGGRTWLTLREPVMRAGLNDFYGLLADAQPVQRAPTEALGVLRNNEKLSPDEKLSLLLELIGSTVRPAMSAAEASRARAQLIEAVWNITPVGK